MSSTEPLSTPSRLIVPLREVSEEDGPLVGAKAHSLGLMLRAGLPVPDGFCLTTHAMSLFVEQGGLGERLAAIAARCRGEGLDAKESWAFLGETRTLIGDTELPEAIRAPLRKAYEEQLSGGVVAVRSSGTKEDLEGASFAGQYESILNVRGFDFLEEAVKRCWASIWRNRVLQYTGQKAGGVGGLSLSVLVQRLVKAEAAGVLFTLNPLTGRDSEMLVEATVGLGETLVGGKVNPDRFVLDARSGAVLREEVVKKERRLRARASRDSDGDEYEGAEEELEAVPAEAQLKPALDREALAKLARVGLTVQRHHGRPMDVEFAAAGGELMIVQARPITKIGFAEDLGEWTNANFKDGGVASDVCAPFMSSLYDRIFSTTMETWFRTLRLLRDDRKIDWLHVFYGKPYWNVGEVKRLLVELPGFIERDFDEDLGLERPYEGLGRVTPMTLKGIIRAIPILFAVRRAYTERLALAKAYVPKFLETYARLDAIDLDALPRAELVASYERLIEEVYVPTESTYFLTVYALSNSKIDFKVLFDKLKKASGEALGYLGLIVGLKDVAHLRPYKELYELAAKARAQGTEPDLGSFLSRWQYHSTRELDLRVPRWGEDPTFVRESARQYRDAGLEDPAAVEARQRTAYEQERAKLAALFKRPRLLFRPLLRFRFLKGLRRIRDYAWWREEMRDCSMRCYWLVRKHTLALGRRLAAEGAIGKAEDLLMLTYAQVLDLARGALAPEKARDEIAWNAAYLEGFRYFKNPNELGLRHRQDKKKRSPAGGNGLLRGVAGSEGTVKARAKVVRRLEEAHKVGPGDVLVTVFTDPGWTPLMSVVGALVTETGGLLSHAAVISREYGIPAVLACAGATEAIGDGDLVEVDGAAGEVRLLEKAAAVPAAPPASPA